MNRTRRDALTLSAALAVPAAAAAAGNRKPVTTGRKSFITETESPETALYSEVISCGDFVFVSGHGTNKVGGIREQTEFVLNEIDACLKAAGSSMAKAVKCNVYLSKLEDYEAMNEAYLGKFGSSPLCAPRLPLPASRWMARWLRLKSWRKDDYPARMRLLGLTSSSDYTGRCHKALRLIESFGFHNTYVNLI